MKLLRNKRVLETKTDMTPMIDIVFQLIIFFMVVMTIAKVEVTDIVVPEADEGRAMTQRRTDVIINVRQNGETIVGGAAMSPVQITAFLQKRKAAGPVRVHLRGDERTSFAPVRAAMKACAQAGVLDVVLAVSPIAADEGAAP